MDPERCLARIGEDCCADDVARFWQESTAAMPAVVPGFLDPAQVVASRERCGLGAQHDETLVATARLIADDEALRRLAWHCKWRLFDLPGSDELKGWPKFERALGDRAGVFYLLIGLAMVPHVEEYHRSIGIPADITRDTCLCVRGFCEMYRRGHAGHPGIQPHRVSWLRHYPRSPLLRIGRLEYWPKPNPVPITVYRHRLRGYTVAFAEAGTRFTRDGYIDKGVGNPPDGWPATLEEGGEAIAGTPVSPSGRGLRDPVALPVGNWGCALRENDPVLQVHIPAGGKLYLDSVRDSLQRALAFFDRRFPTQRPRAFVSTSWAFSPLLEELLPANSHLVRFLRELYLLPIMSGAYGGLSYVFPEDQFDPATASRRTSLQRAILDHIQSGKRWRIGGMFLLPADLEHFGTQHYRHQWRQWLADGVTRENEPVPRTDLSL